MDIVLTGGIATGKSTVAKMLEEEGFVIVDADKIAHGILDKSAKEIEKLFGKKFVKKGQVDRKELGALVFGDKNERRKLEKLLHPLIKSKIEEDVKELKREKKRYIVDIPLYFETQNYKAKKVVLVYARKEQQIQRVSKRDGLSKEDALKRIKAQMDIEKKRELADIIIDNSKDFMNLKREVKSAVSKI